MYHQALNAHKTKEHIFIYEIIDIYGNGVVLVVRVLIDVLANDNVIFLHSLRFFNFWAHW